jgi:hypothetical protein
MYNFKSSPLLTYERKHSFNRKLGRQNKKRVRIQPVKRDTCGIRNPFSRFGTDLSFLPLELHHIGTMECLTYKVVSDLEYGSSRDFARDITNMKAAVKRQEGALESMRDIVRKHHAKS